jgi:hypothetical protein
MLDDLLCNVGIPVYLVSKYGTKTKTTLKVEKKGVNVEPKLQWRVQPKLCCEFSFINLISAPVECESGYQISFMFTDFKLTVEIGDKDAAELAIEIYDSLCDYLTKSKEFLLFEKEQNTAKGTTQIHSHFQQTLSMRKAIVEAALKEEQLIQMCFYLRYKEAHMLVSRAHTKYVETWVGAAFSHWVSVLKDVTTPNMTKDRHRWRLHATANQDIDLQAWYHALFYLEVIFLVPSVI